MLSFVSVDGYGIYLKFSSVINANLSLILQPYSEQLCYIFTCKSFISARKWDENTVWHLGRSMPLLL